MVKSIVAKSQAEELESSRNQFTDVPTLGDGNCSLNAFALALSDLLRHNLLPIISDEDIKPLLRSFSKLTGQRASLTALKEWLKTTNQTEVQKILAPGLRALYADILRNSNAYLAEEYRSRDGNQAMLLCNDFENFIDRMQSKDVSYYDNYFEKHEATNNKFKSLYQEIDDAVTAYEVARDALKDDQSDNTELADFDLEKVKQEKKEALLTWWSQYGWKEHLKCIEKNGQHLTNHALGVLCDWFEVSCDIKTDDPNRQYSAFNGADYHGYFPEKYVDSLTHEQKEKMRNTIAGTTLLQGNSYRIGRIHGNIHNVFMSLKKHPAFKDFNFEELLDILAKNYVEPSTIHFRHSASHDHWNYRRPTQFNKENSYRTALHVPPSLHSLAVLNSDAFRSKLSKELRGKIKIADFDSSFTKLCEIRETYLKDNIVDLGIEKSHAEVSSMGDFLKNWVIGLDNGNYEMACLTLLKLLLANNTDQVDLSVHIYLANKFPEYVNAVWKGTLNGNEVDFTLLHKAVSANNKAWVDSLLEIDGILVNSKKCGDNKHVFGTALAVACSMKDMDIEIVRALLKKGVDANICDSKSRSPLMLAAQNGRFDILLELLSRPDVRVLVVDLAGCSALDYLKQSKHSIKDKLLNAANNEQRLHIAKEFHLANILELLNFAKTEREDSPIHVATIDLAEAMLIEFNTFSQIKNPTPNDGREFMQACNNMMKEKTRTIANNTKFNRIAWNLLLSTSVVGMVAIIINAIYAKATKGAFELLWQPPVIHTVDEAKESLKQIEIAISA